VRHGASIGTAVSLTLAAALLFANINVIPVSGVVVRHRTDVGTIEGFFPSALVAVTADFVMRHRSNIRAAEDLLLAAAIFASVEIVALAGLNVWTAAAIFVPN